MSSYLPLLSLAGIHLGFLLWSALARGFGGHALLHGMRPVPEREIVGRLTIVYFRLAIPWVIVLGLLAAWIFVTPTISRGWFWLCVGALVAPIVGGITFARYVRKRSASSDGLRSNISPERTRER